MYADRRLIDRVREFLGRRDQTLTPDLKDLAEQYSALCRRVASRMEACATYLARGLRSEAQHVAGSEPPLLEMVRIIQSEDIESWAEVCVTYGLPEAVPLRPELVTMLGFAFDEGREDSREESELLRRWRKVALLGSTPQKLHVLRRLATQMGHNAWWEGDVAAFEAYRLQEIDAEFAQALTQEDEPRLACLMVELNALDWQDRPPQVAVKSYAEKHRVVRRKKLAVEASRMAATTASLHNAQDFDGLEEEIRRWTEMEGDPDFLPPKAARTQVEDARAWHRDRVREREDLAEFTRKLSELEHAIGRAPTSESLDGLLAALATYQREVPQELSERAAARVDALRWAEGRRRRMRVLGVVGVILVAMGGLGAGAWLLLQKHDREAWLAKIDASIREDDWPGADRTLAELQSREATFAEYPEVRSRRVKVDAALRDLARWREEFATILADLEGMRGAGFQPLDRASSLIARAEPLARHAEDRLAFERMKTAVEDVRSAFQRSADERVRTTLQELVKALQRVAEIDPLSNPDAYRKEFDRAALLYEQVALTPPGAADLKGRVANAKQAMDGLQKEYGEALANLERGRKRWEAIYDGPPDLARYASALEEASRLADMPASDLQRVLDLLSRCPAYQQVIAASALRVSGDRDRPEQIDALIRSPLYAQGPWSSTLDVARSDAEWSTRVEGCRKALRSLAGNDIFANLLWIEAQDKKGALRPFYFLKTPTQKAKFGDRWVFEGEIYNENHDLVRQEFTYPRDVLDANLVPHAKYVRDLVQRAAERPVSEFAAFLCKELHAISVDKTLNPCIAIMVALELLRPLVSERDPLLDPVRELVRSWEELDTNVYWIDPSPAVQRSLDPLRKALDGVPDLAPSVAAWQFRRRLFEVGLNRGLRCVGIVATTADGESFRVSVETSQELWIAKVDAASHEVRFHIVGAREGAAFVVREDARSILTEGEPLFSPGDSKSTQGLLRQITKETGIEPERVRSWSAWPDTWPVNERRLNEGK